MPSSSVAPPSAIEDHVAIGDGRSVALTDGRGAIDWLCWPRFDSEPIFSSLLDASRGGSFRVAPRGLLRSSAAYLPDTNVAITRFQTEAGAIELLDLMPIDGDGTHERTLPAEHELLRVLSCSRGGGEIEIAINPRPSFGLGRARLSVEPGGTLRFEDRGSAFVLRASRPLAWREDPRGGLRCTSPIEAGERIVFALDFAAESPLLLSPLDDGGHALVEATVTAWRTWAAKARYEGRYRAEVLRSALTLKLLCYPPSGAIVAAPTTSLPEARGGDRNWDYRFCWLRDAALTARALFGLGYEREADAFIGWLSHATHLTRPRLAVLYGLFGGAPRPEIEIASLDGYGGARPVRIGNGAADQVQLDVYGEVIDAVTQAWRRGRNSDPAEREMIVELGTYVAAHWRGTDSGIWETRAKPEHHVHSRVLSWVALDRILELSDEGVFPLRGEQRDRFARERAAIETEVRTRGYSANRSSYVSTLDGGRLDASLLLLSWYGFEPASSPRMRGTFAAIDRELGIGRGLLRRNLDLPDDGGFVACAFWAAEHLARGGGTLSEARERFEALIALSAPSGLYAEIVDETGSHLGNYPQGFSHLALLNAALSLEEREKGEKGGLP